MLERTQANHEEMNYSFLTSLYCYIYCTIMCGKIKYPADILVLGSPQDDFCPIIFGRPFLNTVNAKIDCNKETVIVNFGDVPHEFNFSKFHRQPCDKELPSKDEIISLASIVVPPTDPLEQYLLDQENDMKEMK